MQAKENTTYVCEKCRCESELRDQYVSNSRLFKSVQYVCITCHFYAKKSDVKRGVINLFIFGGIAAMIFQSIYGVEHIIQFIASCFILAYPTILLHELGHAIACWLVGFRVQAIQIGTPRIAGFHKLGQTYCAVGFLPGSGMVIPLAIRSTPTRFKLLIVYTAGIIANILGAIGGYLFWYGFLRNPTVRKNNG